VPTTAVHGRGAHAHLHPAADDRPGRRVAEELAGGVEDGYPQAQLERALDRSEGRDGELGRAGLLRRPYGVTPTR
jgi:hypothetical protein